MAGMKAFIRNKLSASSVLEVVIAMVIILVVFGMGLMIFTNVTRMSLSANKLEAEGIVRKTLLLVEQSDKPTDQSFQEGGFRIVTTLKPDTADSVLIHVSVDAYDIKQQKLATAQKLIIKEHE